MPIVQKHLLTSVFILVLAFGNSFVFASGKPGVKLFVDQQELNPSSATAVQQYISLEIQANEAEPVEQVELFVLDADGRIMARRILYPNAQSQNTRIPVGRWPAGTYNLILKTEKETQSYPISVRPA